LNLGIVSGATNNSSGKASTSTNIFLDVFVKSDPENLLGAASNFNDISVQSDPETLSGSASNSTDLSVNIASPEKKSVQKGPA